MTYFVLEHARCGCFGGLAQDRRMLDGRRRIAVAAGYHNWRVRILPATQVEAAIEVIVRGPCETCRMDPTRGGMPAAVAVAGAELVAGNLPRVHLQFGAEGATP